MKKLLLLAVLSVSQAFAQPVPTTALSFSMVGWGETIDGLKYRNGSEYVDLGTIPLFEKGRRFKYSGPRQIRIYDRIPASAKGAEDQPAAIAEIPSGMKRALILIAPRGDRYECLVVPDDLDTIPAGQALVVNLSPQALGIRSNKKESFKLDPKKSKLLRPGVKDLVQLDVHHETDGNWKRVRNFFLPLPPTTQTMIFFLKSDSDYFKDADGRVNKEVQTVVLRRDLSARESDDESGDVAAAGDGQSAGSESAP